MRLRRGFGRNERRNSRCSLLTLSAPAWKRIPWLYFNRCSTTRIRQGDLAVLSPAARTAYLCMRYANESRLARLCLLLLRAAPKLHCPQTQVFTCAPASRPTCMHERRWAYSENINRAAWVSTLAWPKGRPCPRRGHNIVQPGSSD